ncbi:MAG: aldehyde dehydrogenase family protein [Variovorax sp.]|nr:aldehyde dehydrogenase family protein [Variovorax sp.]
MRQATCSHRCRWPDIQNQLSSCASLTTQTFDNLINGEWVAGAKYALNVNPSNLADIIGDYTQARHDVLDKIGTEILARREKLGTLVAREEVETKPEGIGEVTREPVGVIGLITRGTSSSPFPMATRKEGDAPAAGIDIGPVSSQSQLEQDMDRVAFGQKEGATLVDGLRRGVVGCHENARSRPDSRLAPRGSTVAASAHLSQDPCDDREHR